MTPREKLCIRVLLLVARLLAPSHWSHDIAGISTSVAGELDRVGFA